MSMRNNWPDKMIKYEISKIKNEYNLSKKNYLLIILL